jgi:hypothetical protein
MREHPRASRGVVYVCNSMWRMITNSAFGGLRANARGPASRGDPLTRGGDPLRGW